MGAEVENMETIRYEEKEQLTECTNITLNNEPAKIYGKKLDFPIIASHTLRAEFSWEAVKHIVSTKQGKFKI